MTGYAESEVLRLAMQGSPQKHIQKPFTISGLLAQVSEALATRWNHREDSQAPQYPTPQSLLREAPDVSSANN